LQSGYYDPVVGRFINSDDVDIIDGGNDHILENNLFAYCFNNPVNNVDPSGHATKKVVLDPGHGGTDWGAVYKIYKKNQLYKMYLEKVFNLRVVVNVCIYLRNSGINVNMTRTTDRTISFYARYSFAN